MRSFDKADSNILEPVFDLLDKHFTRIGAMEKSNDYYKELIRPLLSSYPKYNEKNLEKIVSIYKEYYKRVPIFDSYYPEFVDEHKDFKAFTHGANVLINELFIKVSHFTELVNSDKVPEGFINALAAALSYEFTENIPVPVQREILRRILRLYRLRGSTDDVVNRGSFYDNKGYLGAGMFIPGTFREGYKMSMSFPRQYMFIHSYSSRSRVSRYPDAAYFRDGLISFNTPFINDKLKAAIAKVVPAGVTMAYTIVDEVSYGDLITNAGKVNKVLFGYNKTEIQSKVLVFDDALKNGDLGIHTFDYNQFEAYTFQEGNNKRFIIGIDISYPEPTEDGKYKFTYQGTEYITNGEFINFNTFS